MKVKTYGFSLDTNSGYVSIGDLFSNLSQETKIIGAGENNERRFYIDESNSKYYKGLVVTVKDQKAFCKLEEDSNGAITIEVENLEGENRLMEFNFFVLNKLNGLGLYQHYFQSCGTSVFGDYLKSFHKGMRDDLAKQDIEGHKERHGSITSKEEQAIKSEYRDALQFSLLVRPENLEKILEDLHEIKAFNYDYTTVEAISRRGEPLSSFVTKRTERVSFRDTANRIELIKAIAAQVVQYDLKKGAVSGKDASGEALTLKIVDMPDYFGIEEFDTVAQKLNHLSVTDFSEHLIIIELIKAATDFKHIFEAEIEPKET